MQKRVASLYSTGDTIENVRIFSEEAILRRNTGTESGYERVFKEALVDMGAKALYEPFRLHIISSCKTLITYTPDFLLPFAVGGRKIMIETHPIGSLHISKAKEDFANFASFKRLYGRMFYFVVASDLHPEALKLRTGVSMQEFCDEYWMVCGPFRDKSDQNAIKETVRMHLEKLLARSDPVKYA